MEVFHNNLMGKVQAANSIFPRRFLENNPYSSSFVAKNPNSSWRIYGDFADNSGVR
jgi:hypothetical protein